MALLGRCIRTSPFASPFHFQVSPHGPTSTSTTTTTTTAATLLGIAIVISSLGTIVIRGNIITDNPGFPLINPTLLLPNRRISNKRQKSRHKNKQGENGTNPIQPLAPQILNELGAEEDGGEEDHGDEGGSDAGGEVDHEEVVDECEQGDVEVDSEFCFFVDSLFAGVGVFAFTLLDAFEAAVSVF